VVPATPRRTLIVAPAAAPPPPRRRRQEFPPPRMARQIQMIEIIHPRTFHVFVAKQKAARLDDVHGHGKTGAQAHERAGVLRDIGLKKRQSHETDLRVGPPTFLE